MFADMGYCVARTSPRANGLASLPISPARPQHGAAIGDGRFPKERLRYDEAADCYHGPGERRLGIVIEAHDVPITAGDTASTLKVVTRVGARGKALRETPNLLPVTEPIVRSALAARERDGLVHLGSATWIATATA